MAAELKRGRCCAKCDAKARRRFSRAQISIASKGSSMRSASSAHSYSRDTLRVQRGPLADSTATTPLSRDADRIRDRRRARLDAFSACFCHSCSSHACDSKATPRRSSRETRAHAQQQAKDQSIRIGTTVVHAPGKRAAATKQPDRLSIACSHMAGDNCTCRRAGPDSPPNRSLSR